MATAEEYRKQLKLEIHSLLCVEKEPISANQLHRNYREIMSNNILWVRLGHKNLPSLLKSMKDILTYSNVNGEWMFKAIPKGDSAHINQLVAEQKPAKTNAKKNMYDGNRPSTSNVQHQNGILPIPHFRGPHNQMQHGHSVWIQSQGNHKMNAPIQNLVRQQPSQRSDNQSNNQQQFYQSRQNFVKHQQTVQQPSAPQSLQSQSNDQDQFYQSCQNFVGHPQAVQQVSIACNVQSQEREECLTAPAVQNVLQLTQQATVETSNESSSHCVDNQHHNAVQIKAEPINQPSRPKPGNNLEKVRQYMLKKPLVSQATSTEPIMQSDKQTQTPEPSPVKPERDSSEELSFQIHQLSLNEEQASPSKHVREVHSRASTEPSVSLPTFSNSTSSSSHLTCVSRLGDTTFVRVIPAEPPALNRSFPSSITPTNPALSATFNPRVTIEGDTCLERLVDMSKKGLIGRLSNKHLRTANGRFRAFIAVDNLEFSSLPMDFIHYTDAYERAARNALIHFETIFMPTRRG